MNNNYKKIASLIAKKILTDLTTEENKKLEEWLNERLDNRRLFEYIKNSGNYTEWLRFRENRMQNAYEEIFTAIKKQKIRSAIKKFMSAAACTFLLVLIGLGIYYFAEKRPSENSKVSQQTIMISPGTSKAILVLDDGKSVLLDTPEKIEIVEKDGSIIRKEENQLDYTGQEISDESTILFNSIHIPGGGEYDLLLSDGTRVFLNSLTEFRYPVQFTGKTREVELTGEAFFEVAGSEVPFIVKTNELVVEVTGTSFNINAYKDAEKMATTLVDGEVKVRSLGNKEECWILMPEEQAVYDPYNRKMEVKKVDVTLFTGWKDGELIFYDTRLEDIMTTLTRWYSAKVFYMNPSVKDLRFSGSLNKYQEIEHILDIIESTKKVRIEINGTTILFMERS